MYKKIRIGKKYLKAIQVRLGARNLVILRGGNGYIMCGYLNLTAAQRFKDIAIKISGVSTVKEALKSSVASCTASAKRLGIYKGQPIREVIKIIA